VPGMSVMLHLSAQAGRMWLFDAARPFR